LARPNRYSLILTPEIKSLIARKNALRRIAQRSWGDPPVIRELKISEFKFHNNLVRESCSKLRNENFGNKLQSLRPGHKSLWNFTKIIKNKTRNIPALKVDGNYLLTGQEKADAIASVFSNAHLNLEFSNLESAVEEGCSVLSNTDFNVDPSSFTSPREIKKIIKKLKNCAPGFDDIPNILLKHLSRKALVYLTYIFNSCIKFS